LDHNRTIRGGVARRTWCQVLRREIRLFVLA
jgi:hypothetical protein